MNVDALALHEPDRRLGIGTQMMDTSKGRARERDASVALVETHLGSERSVP